MEIRRGIAVTPGVAIGPALVLDTEGVVISQRTVPADQVEAEVHRLDEALALAAADARLREHLLSEKLGKDIGDIFQAHAFLAEDPSLRRALEGLIRTQLYTAEYAVSRHIRSVIKRLDELPSDHQYQYARLRADFLDLEKNVLLRLRGEPATGPIPLATEPVIVLAHDLTPSETAGLDPDIVHAFATESGGPTSHTAIMADALGLPAVVGIGRFLTDVSGGAGDSAIPVMQQQIIDLQKRVTALEGGTVPPQPPSGSVSATFTGTDAEIPNHDRGFYGWSGGDFVTSYDAGSVTTGALTGPVVLALALGVSSVIASRSAVDDAFGLLGAASIGPIIVIVTIGWLRQ